MLRATLLIPLLALACGGAPSSPDPSSPDPSSPDPSSPDPSSPDPSTSPDPAPSGPTVVTGLVVELSVDEGAVPRATLELWQGGARVAQTEADAFGAFVFPPLPPGRVELRAFGPSGAIHGTTTMSLTLSGAEVDTVVVSVAPGCRLDFDAAEGTDGASCDGHVELSLPPGLIGAAGPYAGPATADIAAQPPELRLAGPDHEVVGAVEVRLRDESGAPLQLPPGAQATLRFPVAAAPDAALIAEWFDPSTATWTPDGTLRAVTDGDATIVELTVTHFSSYRARLDVGPPLGCARAQPEICAQGSLCFPARDVWITLRAPDRFGYVRSSGPFGAACFALLPGHNDVSMRAVVRGPGGLPAVFEGEASAAGRATSQPCTLACEDLGPVKLWRREWTCATGDISISCGEGCTEPLHGPVSVTLDGLRVAEVELPASCAEATCVPVPRTNGRPVRIEHASGQHVEFIPQTPATAAPCLDGQGAVVACGPATDCHDVSELVPGCRDDATCVEAALRATVQLATSACPPERPALVVLDAHGSQGDISRFAFALTGLDGATLDAKTDPSRITTLCAPYGRVVASVTAIGRFVHGRSRRHRAEMPLEITAPAVAITAEPGLHVARGSEVRLVASVLGNTEHQYAFTWRSGPVGAEVVQAESSGVLVVRAEASERYVVEVRRVAPRPLQLMGEATAFVTVTP